MLIAMAGLPATGKSLIAQGLAIELPAIVLDKDKIRAALFPPSEIEYSLSQDDFCFDVMCQIAEYIFRRDSSKHVIFDGRTFTKKYQIDKLIKFVAIINKPLKIIECTCSDYIAKQRLEKDIEKRHIAENRDFELYTSLKVNSNPITEAKLVLNTDTNDLKEYIKLAKKYITGGRDLQ